MELRRSAEQIPLISILTWSVLSRRVFRWTALGCCAALAFCTDLRGQSTSAEMPLRSICFFDPDRGWAVGDGGTLLATQDAGIRWTQQTCGTNASLRDIRMLDLQRGIVVGQWHEPHTRLGRGVILVTDDGGQNWRTIEGDFSPLRTLLADSDGRCIAAGDWSPVYLSSVLWSANGGRTWQGVEGCPAGGVVSVAGSLDDFLALSDRGEVARIRLDRRGRPLVETVMPPGSGWTLLAGDGETRFLEGSRGGLQSSDGGASWRLASRSGENDSPLANHSAITVLGSTAWAARNASALIDRLGGLDAAHGDKSSMPMSASVMTGKGESCATAIHDLFFLDDDRGWAVGDWGTILASRDGGQSWRTVRGGHQKPAILAIACDGRSLPWSLLAIEALQQSRRVGVVVSPGTQTSQADRAKPETSLWLADQDVLQQAVTLLEGISLSPREIGAEAIEAIVLANGPAVLVLDHRLSDDEKRLWSLAAVQSGVRRVIEAGKPGGQTIHSGSALPAVGLLAGDLWSDALALIAPGHISPDRVELLTRLDSVADIAPTEGIATCASGDSRFVRAAPPQPSRRQLQILQARAGEPAWAEAIVASGRSRDDFVSQVNAMLDRAGETEGQRLLMRLLVKCRSNAAVEPYRTTLRLAADRWPDHPLGRMADLKWRSIAQSIEWDSLEGPSQPWATRTAWSDELSSVNSDHRGVMPVRHVDQVLLSPFQESTPAGVPPAGKPDAYSGFSSTGFAVSGANTVAGNQIAQAGGAAPIQGLGPSTGQPIGRQSLGPGVAHANAESPQHQRPPTVPRLDLLWQVQGPVLTLKAAEESRSAATATGQRVDPGPESRVRPGLESVGPENVVISHRAHPQPFLDGKCDEAWWPEPHWVVTRAGRASIRLAHDEVYHYFAIEIPNHPRAPSGGNPASPSAASRAPRQRDYPLDETDRWVLRLDVDGDLMTCFELEFDREGNTRDSCDGFPQWDPRWFIAVHQEPSVHRVELAIQKASLLLDRVATLEAEGAGNAGKLKLSHVMLEHRLPGESGPAITMPNPAQWCRILDRP